MFPKAIDQDIAGRFREIISDPINIAIHRDPKAGFMDSGYVYLHNGIRVPVAGPHVYYGQFSSVLVINRGVHEPLEEYVFQEVLKFLPGAPTMIELGAYWGHYSMWMQKVFPGAKLNLVEPEKGNIEAGMHNFKENGFTGKFINEFVGTGKFSVDRYIKENNIQKLDVLHADIQKYELEMLADCQNTLSKKIVDHVFISTHSGELHEGTVKILNQHGYRVEVSSDFDNETTSYDGFVYASNPRIPPLFPDFKPMGRIDILKADPSTISEYIAKIVARSGTK